MGNKQIVSEWEECAQHCRQNNLCTYWITSFFYTPLHCYIFSGSFVPYTGSGNESLYIVGYRDCTPGKGFFFGLDGHDNKLKTKYWFLPFEVWGGGISVPPPQKKTKASNALNVVKLKLRFKATSGRFGC